MKAECRVIIGDDDDEEGAGVGESEMMTPSICDSVLLLLNDSSSNKVYGTSKQRHPSIHPDSIPVYSKRDCLQSPSIPRWRGEQRVVELFHNLRSNHETFIIFSEKATTLDLEFDPPLRTKSEARLRGDR